jgi:tetratricopeptide (TPR) repeat protein
VAWFSGLVDKQNGFLDQAIAEFRGILEDRYLELDQRGFDFSKDYVVINELGQALVERAKAEWQDQARQRELLAAARQRFEQTLALDPENLTAHYNLALIFDQLGEAAQAAEHRRLHEKYRPDDNARDSAIAVERRRNPAADHAAQATVI